MKKNQLITDPCSNKIPAGNYIVMLLISVIFAFQFLGDPQQMYLSGCVLKKISFNALIMYFWLHTSLVHVVSNIVLLAIFGPSSCRKIGDAKFVLIYFLLGFTAAFAHLLFDGRPVIGASGAIFGVLGVGVVLSWRKLSWMGPWLIFIWVVASIGAAAAGTTAIAHVTHIAGLIIGMFTAIVLLALKQADNRDTDRKLLGIILNI